MKFVLGILSIFVVPVAIAFLLVNSSGQDTQAHAPSGAIFTTDAKGEPVNANIYSNKHKVHLNGGPPLNAPPARLALIPATTTTR